MDVNVIEFVEIPFVWKDVKLCLIFVCDVDVFYVKLLNLLKVN